MRYSKEHKVETHARIVKKASARLRERGAHGVGVADLMKDAGLTHGGFYSHFDSREALVIEAFSHAMDQSIESWRKLLSDNAPAKQFEAVVDSYLTPGHRDNLAAGCAVPSLGADIARENSRTRKAFTAKLEDMMTVLAGSISDATPKAARRQALAAMSTMVGSVLLARIAGHSELSDTILSAGREAVLGSGRASKTSARAPVKSTIAKKAIANKSSKSSTRVVKPAARKSKSAT
jgi:TetR/AcrR family transcriptional repressor of nem operon